MNVFSRAIVINFMNILHVQFDVFGGYNMEKVNLMRDGCHMDRCCCMSSDEGVARSSKSVNRSQFATKENLLIATDTVLDCMTWKCHLKLETVSCRSYDCASVNSV